MNLKETYETAITGIPIIDEDTGKVIAWQEKPDLARLKAEIDKETIKEKLKKRRPTKLTKNLVEAIKIVLSDTFDAIILTDADIVRNINEILPKKEQITESLFKQWKGGYIPKTANESDILEFLSVIKNAIEIERKNLFENLKTDQGGWQRWAWIIERKFSEWRLKQEIDHTTKGESINETKLSKSDIDSIKEILKNEF